MPQYVLLIPVQEVYKAFRHYCVTTELGKTAHETTLPVDFLHVVAIFYANAYVYHAADPINTNLYDKLLFFL